MSNTDDLTIIGDNEEINEEINEETFADPKNIRTQVEIIQKCIQEPQYAKLKSENFSMFRIKMEEKFSDFYQKYPTLMKLLVKEENIDMLEVILQKIEKIKKSEVSKDDGELDMGQHLYDTYVFPVTGKRAPAREEMERQRKILRNKMNKEKK